MGFWNWLNGGNQEELVEQYLEKYPPGKQIDNSDPEYERTFRQLKKSGIEPDDEDGGNRETLRWVQSGTYDPPKKSWWDRINGG